MFAIAEYIIFTVQNKPEYWSASGGLEYENAWALGADTGIDDLEALTSASFVCNEHSALGRKGGSRSWRLNLKRAVEPLGDAFALRLPPTFCHLNLNQARATRLEA